MELAQSVVSHFVLNNKKERIEPFMDLVTKYFATKKIINDDNTVLPIDKWIFTMPLYGWVSLHLH